MEIAQLTSKGQITIPKAVRDALGVDTGDKVVFVRASNGFFMCNGESVLLSASVSETAPAEEVAFVEPKFTEKSGEGKKKKKKKKKKD